MKNILCTLLFLFISLIVSFSQPTDCFTLKASSETAQPGESICVDVSVWNFTDIVSLQFGMSWDTSVLAFETFADFNLPYLGTSSINVNDNYWGQEVLHLAWIDHGTEGITLPDGTTIFRLCFNVIGNTGEESPVIFDTSIMQTEVGTLQNTQLEVIPVHRAHGKVQLSDVPPSTLTIAQACTQHINCSGNNEGAISAIPEGGTPPYSFNWTGPEGYETTNLFPLASNPGIYSVTVTDAVGDWIAADLEVWQDGGITLENSSITNTPCEESSGAIYLELPDGNFSFLWNNGMTTEDIIDLPAGQYSVTVTDMDTECSNTFSFLVYPESSSIQYNVAVTHASCDGIGNGAIDLTVSNGNPPYSYQWSNGATTEDATDLPSGNYVVTITDNSGCQLVSDQITIFGELLVGISHETTLINDTTEADIHSVVWAGGVPPYTWNWSTGDITYGDPLVPGDTTSGYISTLEDVPAGFYIVTVTDANDCTWTSDPIEITQECEIVLDNITVTNAACDGSATGSIDLELQEGSYAFMWSNNMSSEDISGLAPGQYSVTVTDLISGCDDSFSFSIFSNPPLEYSISVTNASDESASDGSISVNVWGGTLPYSFFWLNELPTTQNLIDLPPDIYSLIITDASSCQAEAEVVVSHNCGFVLEDAVVTDVSCDGTINGSIDITVSGGTSPYSYIWSNGGTYEDITNLDPGSYFVTITDASGCTFSPEGFIVLGGFLIDIYYETTLFTEPDTTYVLADIQVVWEGGTPPYNLSWNTGAITEWQTIVPGDPSSGNISTLEDVPARTYTVTITDASNCVGVSESITIENPPAPQTVQFNASDEEVIHGETVCLDVSVMDFDSILSLQFSMHWDTAVLAYESVQNFNMGNLGAINFGTNLISAGYLSISWYDSALGGVSIQDGETIFQVCFEVVGEEGESTDFEFVGVPTEIEVYNNAIAKLVFISGNGSVTIVPDGSVWPGDTEKNGTANQFDILNIGLGYENTGPARPDASLEWMAQYALDWETSTPNTEVNYKHADVDGNGTINVDDTLGIILNWGMIADEFVGIDEGKPALPLSPAAMMLPMYVRPDTLILGETVSLLVFLGNEETPANDVYGLAFSLIYDPGIVVPQSAYLTFENSWLGTEGENLITIQKDFHDQGRIDIGITRIDGMNISGSGEIGQLHITLEDVIFRNSEYDANFSIDNIRIINFGEEEIPVQSETTTSSVESTTGTKPIQYDPSISVFPVPAKQMIYIQSENGLIDQIELYNASGQLMKTLFNAQKVPVDDMIPGNYYLRITTSDKVVIQKVQVIE